MSEPDRLLDAARRTANGTADSGDRCLLEEAHPADVAAVLRQLPVAYGLDVAELARDNPHA